MRVVFSGVFPVENAPPTGAQEAAAARWQCRVCYFWNENPLKRPESPPSGSEDDQDPTCRLCARPQQPLWLKLAEHDFQVGTYIHALIIAVNRLLSIESYFADILAEKVGLGSLVALSHFKFEDVQLGIIVAIDYAEKKLQVLSVRRSKSMKAETRNDQHEQLRFNEMVIDQQQLGQLEPFDNSESDWIELLGEYAICGDCRRVSHASQGDLQSKFANEDVLHTLRLEIEALEMQKQQQIRANKCDLVLETTSEIQLKNQQLQHVRRQLEFLNPLFCPFCGWKSPLKE